MDWHVITIPTGSYDIEDINDVIQRGMKSNGHWDEANEEFYVSILANPNTVKAVSKIKNKYQVNFKSGKSLKKLLGFNSKVYIPRVKNQRE